MAPQTAVEVGYRDFSFGTNTLATPTGEKPQSKLWWNDGVWWGCLWDTDAHAHGIYRFDPAAQTWTLVGPHLENRSNTLVDVLWDGSILYIVSHLFNTSGSFLLNSFSYDHSTQTYVLRSGFPVTLNSGSAEALTIAKDTMGKLWITWEQSTNVMVNRSLGSETAWGTPFRLPTQGANVNSDDISAITAFGNRLGVMWSNQNDKKMYFSYHNDGDGDTIWQPREDALADAGLAVADDHINFAVACSSDPCIYAVTKTSLATTGQPSIYLLRRDASGTWTRHVVANHEDSYTRAIVLVDDENRKIYVFAQSGVGDNGIRMKVSDMDNISFPPGAGTLFIETASSPNLNNPTSTKQTLNGAMDLVVMASDEDSRYYFHNSIDLPGAPEIAIAPGSHDYGAVLLGASGSQSYKIRNVGTAALHVLSTTLGGTDAAEFAVTNGGGAFTVAPGDSHDVVVSFAPTTAGPKSATLQILNDDSDESTSGVSLVGTGVVPDLAVTPAAHDFGDVRVGSSAGRVFQVHNTGSADLHVTSSLIGGPDLGEFALGAGEAPFAVAPGDSHAVGVNFTPANSGSKGASLQLQSDDPSEPLFEASLVGTGVLPDIAVTPTSRAFGTAILGDSLSQSFVARNTGSGVLHVSGSHISGADSTQFKIAVGAGDFSVAASDSFDIVVRFVPTSEGAKEGTLRISSDDPDENPLNLLLTGSATVVRPDLDVAASHDFGFVASDSSRSFSFAVGNTGLADLHVASTTMIGADSLQFHVSAGEAPFDVAPQQSHTLTVTFTPSGVGPKAAVLRVTSDDPDEDPWDIQLHGTGGVPHLALNTSAHDFGNIGVGGHGSFTLQMRNSGSYNLEVFSAQLGGADTDAFQVTSGAPPFTLAPGDSQQVQVEFDPVTPGPKSALLAVSSNDPDGGTVSIVLTGLGLSKGSNTVVFAASVVGASRDSTQVHTANPVNAVSGDLYLAAITSTTYQQVVSVTGMGLTWTRLASQCAARDQTGVEVWRGQGTPQSGVVTAQLTGVAAGAVILVSRYSGADPNHPLGVMVSGNTLGLSGTCTGGTDSDTIAFPFTTTVGNALVFSAVALRSEDFTSNAGWTERALERTGSGNAASVFIMDRTVPAMGTIGLGGIFNSVADWAVIGIEIHPLPTQTTDAPAFTTSDAPVREVALQVLGSAGDPGSRAIELDLPATSPVQLTLHDVRGRRLLEVWSGTLPAGRHRLSWLGTPDAVEAPAGIYFLRARVGDQVLSRKLVMLR